MKFIHMIYPVIGIMLALVLCITPVAAVSGSDFDIDIENDEDGFPLTYIYHNVNNPNDEYIHIDVRGTLWLYSVVTFKPANVPDAPVMVVTTPNHKRSIHLSSSVDEWEIKYYSTAKQSVSLPDDKYLKNAGVVNLYKVFGEYIYVNNLILNLKWEQAITCPLTSYMCAITYVIPDVD